MQIRGDCQSVLNPDDRGRRKKAELAMGEGLTKLTTYLKQKNER